MGYLTRGATAGGKTYDLLPCPYCGGEAEFRDGSSTAPYIRCKSCGCRTGSGRSCEKLVERWNRRAERTCRVVRYGEPSSTGVPRERHCSECGGRLTRFGSYCPHCGAKIVKEDA